MVKGGGQNFFWLGGSPELAEPRAVAAVQRVRELMVCQHSNFERKLCYGPRGNFFSMCKPCRALPEVAERDPCVQRVRSGVASQQCRGPGYTEAEHGCAEVKPPPKFSLAGEWLTARSR